MKYIHPENKHLEYVDWRKPERRMEGFLRWLTWRVRWSDLDHYTCNNAYRDSANMTKEQSLWFALIFGMTYQSEMAWIIFNEFPNLADIDLKHLQEWNLDTLSIQKYARDTKYNKGRITEQVSSIQRELQSYGSIQSFVDSYCDGTPEQNYDALFEGIQTFHKYGRMTSFITCQVMFETCGVNAMPGTVLATHPDNWSVRSGLMYLHNRDDKIEAVEKNVRFTDSEVKEISEMELKLYERSKEVIDENKKYIFSNYLLESHLCQYKKLMLGGDYPGHSSGDHYSRAKGLEQTWKHIDFNPFYNIVVPQYYNLVQNKYENKSLRELTCETGQMINMHTDFKDMPNMYLELGLQHSDIKSDEVSLKNIARKITDYNKEDRLFS